MITRFDLGANPLDLWIAMVERAHYMLGNLEYHYPAPGQPYYELTRLFVRVLNQYAGTLAGGPPASSAASSPTATMRAIRMASYRSRPCRSPTSAGRCRRYAGTRSRTQALQFSPSLLAKLEQNPAPFSERLTFNAGPGRRTCPYSTVSASHSPPACSRS